MKTNWAVTIYNDLGEILFVECKTFDTKAEASIYGRSRVAGDYSRNFTVEKVEQITNKKEGE